MIGPRLIIKNSDKVVKWIIKNGVLQSGIGINKGSLITTSNGSGYYQISSGYGTYAEENMKFTLDLSSYLTGSNANVLVIESSQGKTNRTMFASSSSGYNSGSNRTFNMPLTSKMRYIVDMFDKTYKYLGFNVGDETNIKIYNCYVLELNAKQMGGGN